MRGLGMRRVAKDLDLKHTTVRDRRRRFARPAGLVAVGFCRYVVALGDLAPRLSGCPDAVAVAAAMAAWAAARRHFGDRVGGLWRLANAVVGRASGEHQHGSALGGCVSVPFDAHRRCRTTGTVARRDL